MREFLAGLWHIIDRYILDLRSVLGEMHMRIIEARQHAFAASIGYPRPRSTPRFHLGIGSDSNDSVPEHSERLFLGRRGINRPNSRISHD